MLVRPRAGAGHSADSEALLDEAPGRRWFDVRDGPSGSGYAAVLGRGCSRDISRGRDSKRAVLTLLLFMGRFTFFTRALGVLMLVLEHTSRGTTELSIHRDGWTCWEYWCLCFWRTTVQVCSYGWIIISCTKDNRRGWCSSVAQVGGSRRVVFTCDCRAGLWGLGTPARRQTCRGAEQKLCDG